MIMTIEKDILEMFFPEGILEWFDIAGGDRDENDLRIILEEKNIPPVEEELKDKKIISKGFKEITITDFPIRGRRTLLTFRRRYWQVEGRKELLKRDIKFNFPGTQLNDEFALFLKEDGGRESGLADFYRQVSSPPGERI
jgi:hypothetical protein